MAASVTSGADLDKCAYLGLAWNLGDSLDTDELSSLGNDFERFPLLSFCC